MSKILVVTVGGSCEPIVNAVNFEKYDRIFFICSTGGRQGSDRTVDGEGKPCIKDWQDKVGSPSIVAQTGLGPDKYEKVLLEQYELDDLDQAYKRIKALAARISGEYPEADVTANFTGGTKTMSACLVMAAIAYDWRLTLNQAVRKDLVKVTSGDTAVSVSVGGLLEDRYIALAEKALDTHDYSMAAAVATEFVKKRITDAKMRTRWLQFKNMSEGFALWDAFSYDNALSCLEANSQFASPWLAVLRNLTYRQRPGHGYHVVFDLINNAERRARQNRYDDAVSRFYRATELVAQTRLNEAHKLESGNISLDVIKSKLSGRLADADLEQYSLRADSNGRIKLALHETYRLLDRLDDPVGKLFMENENKMLDILKVRNHSFLAHGFEPIGRAEYDRVRLVLVNFVQEAVKKAAPSLKTPGKFPGRKLLNLITG